MQLEGKVLGYSKKTVAMVLAFLIVAGVMFYAGAQYEKKKLGSMGLLKNVIQTKKGGTKNKSSQPATAPTDNAGASTGTNTPTNADGQPNGVAPAAPTTPSATPAPSPAKQ
jgi:type II secretory pathway pseudopilin PulG